MLPAYEVETYTDFSIPENRQAFERALAVVEKMSGKDYPLIINGEEVTTGEWTETFDPSAPSKPFARVARAGMDQFEASMSAAEATFETWSRTDPTARARILVRAAAILRREKHVMSALMVREAGKSWPEADADTAEAIDFLEFYAREMIRLDGPQGNTPYPGEENYVFYRPLGIGAIIPPWNFPCAILAGMTAAAVVTGNTVVLKPSCDTPVIGWAVADLFRRAGLPAGVVNFCPGPGAQIGAAMVEDPRTRFINFTGSMEVGLGINQTAAKTVEGQIWIKRVIAEMGGKDAIVVDADSDIDAAAEAIVAAAFGFQGQKCSACSRAILHQDIHDEVVAKVAARAQELTVGPPSDPSNFMGPVINQESYDKIQKYLEIGKSEGRLVTGGAPIDREGYFIQPTVFDGIDSRDRLAQEEIFGPVLACIKAKDFEDAIRIANDTQYGLTGGCFSNRRDRLEYARREFHVGNLYLNRKCTGALVDVQPFGGYNMSGTCSKAGGRDYLKLFLQTKSVTERF